MRFVLIATEKPIFRLTATRSTKDCSHSHGDFKGDVTKLEDFTVIAKLREAEEG